jgi:prepilin-type N-terminal cleavage/methylation domain-containing protein
MEIPRRSISIPRQSRGLHHALLAPRSSLLAPQRAFTLVELLVVITIIGILAGLITVAAVAALKKAQQTRIKVEVDEISNAFETYKDKTTAYPPNAQTDGNSGPLDDDQVLADLQRHIRQIATRTREPDDLVRVLVGFAPNTADFPETLAGGMTAGEAVVFWLSGFSSDPAYPISGEGGPSYEIPSLGDPDNRKLDPIESRRWIYPFAVDRLGPRDADGYFDESQGRFIEYTVMVNGVQQTRRINFWQCMPAKSAQPILYFDTSRHPAAVLAGGTFVGPFDPPAATEPTGLGPDGVGLHVHAVKRVNPVYNPDLAGTVSPIVFVNPDKFQVLHCGIDDAWGNEEGVGFELMSAHGVEEAGGDRTVPESYLLYPIGPFTADVADTIVNFTTGTLEDSQE